MAALLAAIGCALAISPAPASSWEAAGFLLLGVAAAMALIQWPPTRRAPARVAWLLLAAGGAIALLGPLLLGAHGDKLGLRALLAGVPSYAAAVGETVNPNVLAGALLIPLCLALALALGPRWTSRSPHAPVLFPNLFWGLFALVLATEIVLTACRGAWLGAAAGVLVLLWARMPRVAPLLLALAALGVALLLLAYAAGGNLAPVLDAVGGCRPTASTTAAACEIVADGASGRILIWQGALVALVEQPLGGLGLGLFGPWVTQRGLLPELVNFQPHAHNLLLQVTADLGLGGLIAYGAILACAVTMLAPLVRARPRYRRLTPSRSSRTRQEPAGVDVGLPDVPSDGLGRGPMGNSVTHQPAVLIGATYVYRRRLHWSLAAGSAAGLAALLVHGLVDAAVWGNKAAFLPWLLLALICLLYLDRPHDRAHFAWDQD
jgi:hypothetical protein